MGETNKVEAITFWLARLVYIIYVVLARLGGIEYPKVLRGWLFTLAYHAETIEGD